MKITHKNIHKYPLFLLEPSSGEIISGNIDKHEYDCDKLVLHNENAKLCVTELPLPLLEILDMPIGMIEHLQKNPDEINRLGCRVYCYEENTTVLRHLVLFSSEENAKTIAKKIVLPNLLKKAEAVAEKARKTFMEQLDLVGHFETLLNKL